ncbi:MAG: HAD hydrolase family protein [Lachnospiraceae bacterium]|nr:HAD hydrolase family protein [Lachnospiraceae bacterium]
MNYSNAAILTDLDGTLFNSQGKVSANDRTAIQEFIDGGGLFGIASGREPHNARLHLPELPMNGPSIVLNGAAIYDFIGHRYLKTLLMDMEAGADVLHYCQQHDLPLDQQVYTTDGIYYASPLEIANPGFLRIHQPTRFLPMDELLQKQWIKLVFLEREPGALAPMRDYLKQKGYDRRLSLVEGTTDVVECGVYEELLPPRTNKGTAVSLLRELPVYEGRTLFAVGDYWNDMELLHATDVPCCPENAIKEVKEVCQHILPSHNDSPIAYLIREVIPTV